MEANTPSGPGPSFQAFLALEPQCSGAELMEAWAAFRLLEVCYEVADAASLAGRSIALYDSAALSYLKRIAQALHLNIQEDPCCPGTSWILWREGGLPTAVIADLPSLGNWVRDESLIAHFQYEVRDRIENTEWRTALRVAKGVARWAPFGRDVVAMACTDARLRRRGKYIRVSDLS